MKAQSRGKAVVGGRGGSQEREVLPALSLVTLNKSVLIWAVLSFSVQRGLVKMVSKAFNS